MTLQKLRLKGQKTTINSDLKILWEIHAIAKCLSSFGCKQVMSEGMTCICSHDNGKIILSYKQQGWYHHPSIVMSPVCAIYLKALEQ